MEEFDTATISLYDMEEYKLDDALEDLDTYSFLRVCNISYDYVPDHFTNMKIQNPFGTYKNQFEYDENYWK